MPAAGNAKGNAKGAAIPAMMRIIVVIGAFLILSVALVRVSVYGFGYTPHSDPETVANSIAASLNILSHLDGGHVEKYLPDRYDINAYCETTAGQKRCFIEVSREGDPASKYKIQIIPDVSDFALKGVNTIEIRRSEVTGTVGPARIIMEITGASAPVLEGGMGCEMRFDERLWHLEQASRYFGVDKGLAYAIAIKESTAGHCLPGGELKVSGTNDFGIMQLNEMTLRDIASGMGTSGQYCKERLERLMGSTGDIKEKIRNIEYNIYTGVCIIAANYYRVKNADPEVPEDELAKMTFASYNGGPAHIKPGTDRTWIDVCKRGEYSSSVISYTNHAKCLYDCYGGRFGATEVSGRDDCSCGSCQKNVCIEDCNPKPLAA